MKAIWDIRNKIYLAMWSDKKRIDPAKRIQLSRSFMYYHSDVIDLNWSLREVKSDGKKGRPYVLTERTNRMNLVRTIQHVEANLLPTHIKQFKEKLNSQGL